jgi:hypothetical protein
MKTSVVVTANTKFYNSAAVNLCDVHDKTSMQGFAPTFLASEHAYPLLAAVKIALSNPQSCIRAISPGEDLGCITSAMLTCSFESGIDLLSAKRSEGGSMSASTTSFTDRLYLGRLTLKSTIMFVALHRPNHYSSKRSQWHRTTSTTASSQARFTS